MLFSSAIFIFAFLPACLTLFLASRRFRGLEFSLWVLMFCSLFFYSYWFPPYLILLLCSIGGNYFIGRLLSKPLKHRKLIMILGVTLNLVAIFYFKYAGFLSETINTLLKTGFPVIEVALPLGISFFTFQQITYLIDSYDGKTHEHKFGHYALFVSFFPQLIAGPIVHHSEIIPQFLKRKQPDLVKGFGVGISIFTFGLFKKLMIADGLAVTADAMFAKAVNSPVDFFASWGGVMAYTFQLYFDFSGYSDMAIGLGKMFGINIPLNFNSPYKAVSISDFWRRWHMTLSRFLRDYVYIPMGGSRVGKVATYRNLFLTMLIGGLWHGAGWTFVFWGALHGAYLLINHCFQALTRADSRKETFIGITISRVVTFVCVVWAWVFFRATSFAGAWEITRSMLGLNGFVLPERFKSIAGGMERFGVVFYGSGAGDMVFSWALIAFAAFISFFAPNVSQIFGYGAEKQGRIKWKPSLIWALFIMAAFFFAVRKACFAQSVEFLYYDF